MLRWFAVCHIMFYARAQKNNNLIDNYYFSGLAREKHMGLRYIARRCVLQFRAPLLWRRFAPPMGFCCTMRAFGVADGRPTTAISAAQVGFELLKVARLNRSNCESSSQTSRNANASGQSTLVAKTSAKAFSASCNVHANHSLPAALRTRLLSSI